MNKYLIFVGILFLLACSDQNIKEQVLTDPHDQTKLKEKKSKYLLIRDDLYSDEDGIPAALSL